MVDILGKLSFFDSGHLAGGFNCKCGSVVSFDGIPKYAYDNLGREPGFTLWCFNSNEKQYIQHSKLLRCLFCDQSYEIDPVITLKPIKTEAGEKDAKEKERN